LEVEGASGAVSLPSTKLMNTLPVKSLPTAVTTTSPLKMMARSWMPMHNYLVARSSDLHAKGLYLESTDLIGPGLLNVTSILPLFFYND
jgi:hypothetical protein